MTFDASSLENLYRMITPADLLGAQKINDTSKKVSQGQLKDLLDIIYGIKGALTCQDLGSALQSFSTTISSDSDAEAQFKQLINFYAGNSSGDVAKVAALGRSQGMALDRDGKTTINDVTFKQIVGTDVGKDKTMGIILLNSAFLSPAVRNAERIETFMNYLPSIHASRMVPVLDVEFAFNRPNTSRLQSPGLMKFLLGADQSAVSDASSATAKMINAREVVDTKTSTLHSTAGMEMFTSPQTLVNPTPVQDGARYVDVLDPFRPFMSIESFTVNVTPTVGLYSYKKATLVMKLHDRSRLAEISDIIRPQIYQDAASAPTVWITYGWRYPAEPSGADAAGSGTYSDFINANMIVRDAYGIVNTQFSFDQVGQAQLTMELWTKCVPEMRTIKTSDKPDAALPVIQRIRDVAKKISNYSNVLGLGDLEGVNKEVRGTLLIESAERGTFPDLSTKEIQDALSSLEASFKAPGGKIDKAAADALVAELKKFYKTDDKGNLEFKNQIKSQTTSLVSRKFAEVTKGVDPWLQFADKDKKRQEEAKVPPHPFVSLAEAINAYRGEADVSVAGFQKKLVSFGKLSSVFLAHAFNTIAGIDEMQLFFHQFNDRAGAAAGTNIAEFPIDMPVFLDQYREHVERRGTERLSVEEFLRLVVDAQIDDTRAVGYGFRSYFAPYDPDNKHDAKLKDGSEQAFENALAGIANQRGPFSKPALDFYVETTYAAKAALGRDALHVFEDIDPEGFKSDQYTKIMRIHVFDRANNPYKLAGTLLRGDDDSDVAFVEVANDYAKSFAANKTSDANVWQQVLANLGPDAKIKRTSTTQGSTGKNVSNKDIKQYVSKMVPSIIYGGNASSVINATLASKQDPLLSVAQMQFVAAKSGKPTVAQPNGSGVGGLPLRVIPASLSMSTLGCPLLTFGQLFFVDFNSGTSLDNLYGLTGITHSIVPGKFESQMTLTFYDAYGRFEGAPTLINFVEQLQVPAPIADQKSK